MRKRFVADLMLARLARWLRLLDLDVLPAERGDDDLLLRQCVKAKAVLLTRDVRLAQKAASYVPVLLFRSNSLESELEEFFKATHFDVRRIRVAPVPGTRCTLCNGRLRAVTRQSVRAEVTAFAPKSYARARKFWRCRSCRHVFWKGSHDAKIREALQRLKRAAR